MKKVRNYISVLMLGVLIAITAACGGNEKADESAGPAENDAATEQSTMAGAPDQKLNINTASGEAFRTIPGVGDKMVHEFEEYRPYVSIRQFRKEIGKYVDEEQVAAYEKYIFVPVSYNDSDAATLQQLPGIDADKAEQLIAGRPYDSPAAFKDKLSSMITKEEFSNAKNLLKSAPDSE